MVVYRKEPNNLDPLSGTTAAQSVEETSNDATKATTNVSHMVPRAILTSRPNSHPFQERHLSLDQPIKVGRSVARCRPAPSNAIFDCKVLSRNHALLWHENGKFYLQDTKSSNGTFVNNQRLSKGSEESPAREVCSGDIVQFGVDVLENCRKVVHGCIVATLKLYLPDGKEAKASPTTAVVPLSPEASVSSQELYQLSQYLQEALHREQILESKLGTLQKVVANTQDESDIGWKVLIEEDRLLSRIESLESQLQTCGKNITEEKLKDDVLKLQEDKDKYQNAAKESLKKILQEKLDAIRKVQDLENSLSNTENECMHLGEINKKKELEIQLLLEKSNEDEKEISSLTKKLQEAEEKFQDLVNQTTEDKLALENNAEEMRKEEQMLSTKIEALKAENDFAREQLTAMKAHFDILKKDQNNKEDVEKNGNISPHEEHSIKNETAEKNLIQELSCEVNRLELELQRVQKENLKNDTLIYSDSPECTTNGDVKPGDYVNILQAEVEKLRKLLTEARESKQQVETELIQVKGELDEVQSAVKRNESELLCVQEQLCVAKLSVKQKSDQIEELQSRLSITTKERDVADTHEPKPLSKIPIEQDIIELQTETSNASQTGCDNLSKKCSAYEERIKTLEADLIKCIVENTRLEAQSKTLVESCAQLKAAKSALENKDAEYWNDHVVVSKHEIAESGDKLSSAQEEIVLIKEHYEECNKEKSYLQGELNTFKEQLQLLSVQSKMVSVCSVIPLIILAFAMMLAFYPTLAHLTATSDQT